MPDVTAAIYIRVSTEEQTEGWSLEAQRELCTRLVLQRGWSVYKVYEEPGQSAKTDRRPVFQQMLREAERQRFDIILVHKLDRFSRSLPDVVGNVARLKRVGVGLVSVSESWIDTTTPMGEILLYLCALLAQWDNENRARETAKGKAARAWGGLWNGSLSFGYTTVRQLKQDLLRLEETYQAEQVDDAAYQQAIDLIEVCLAHYAEMDERAAILHPVAAAAVVMLYELYSLGTFSDNEVAQLLNEAGYRTYKQRLFTADTVREMLQNRFYLGETHYKGVALPGKHPALIGPELFAKCQEVRAMRRGRREKAASTQRCYPLKGLTYCVHCGKPLRGQANAQHRYYRDSLCAVHACPQKRIRAEVAEQAVVALLASLKLSSDWRERLQAQETAAHPELAQIQVTRARLERQLENAYQLCKAGDMPYNEYATLRDDIQRQLQRLRPVCDDELEAAAALLENLPALLKTATPEDLHLIFHATLKAVDLDSQAANPVNAVEFHPAIKRLLDLSQVAEQAIPVVEADPAPAIDSSEDLVEGPESATSELAIPPQEPLQVPVHASSDRQKESASVGGLKRTAVALKERLFGDLRLLLGYPTGASSATVPWGTMTIPIPSTTPAQVACIT